MSPMTARQEDTAIIAHAAKSRNLRGSRLLIARAASMAPEARRPLSSVADGFSPYAKAAGTPSARPGTISNGKRSLKISQSRGLGK